MAELVAAGDSVRKANQVKPYAAYNRVLAKTGLCSIN